MQKYYGSERGAAHGAGRRAYRVPCAFKFPGNMAACSVGWRGAWRKADTVSKAVRISTEVYGGVRRGGVHGVACAMRT